jgi:hypothetical protein
MLVLKLPPSMIPGICCDVIENSAFFGNILYATLVSILKKNTPVKTLKQLCVLHHVSNSPSD